MVLEPWLDAVWVKGVPTRQEHTLTTQLKVRYAHRARRHLQLSIGCLFAVLLFNLHNRQLFHYPLVGRTPLLLLTLGHLLVQLLDEVLEAEASTVTHDVAEHAQTLALWCRPVAPHA